MKKFYIILVCLSAAIFSSTTVLSQTPGMIFENIGIPVLDPDLNGYASITRTGFDLNDQFQTLQSEIPYVPFPVPYTEPTYDPGPGPNCHFNDFNDIGKYAEPMYSFFDETTPSYDGKNGPFLLFRYRLARFAPNSKSYSVFIDIDGKYGIGGDNPDPNATEANPGFEIEIYCATNFGMGIYNVDGGTSGTVLDGANVEAKDGTYPYEKYVQKAVAWQYANTGCQDQQYFYDFFIPWSAVTALTFTDPATIAAIGGSHVTTSTTLRMAGATIMNPNPGFRKGLDNASLSDWDGIEIGEPEVITEEMIDVFPPTPPDDLDGDTPLGARSDCPSINTPQAGTTYISGISSEEDGTNITVYS